MPSGVSGRVVLVVTGGVLHGRTATVIGGHPCARAGDTAIPVTAHVVAIARNAAAKSRRMAILTRRTDPARLFYIPFGRPLRANGSNPERIGLSGDTPGSELSLGSALVPSVKQARITLLAALASTATPAAAQTLPTPAAPQNVREGFALVWQTLDDWSENFIRLIPNLVAAFIAAILFLLLAWGAATAVRHLVARGGRHDLSHMLGSFVYWATVLFGFLVVITIALPSMKAGDIFASLGIGSVALGFAFKDLLQNWIAGFFILIRRPFHRGDQIKVGDIEGTVQA